MHVGRNGAKGIIGVPHSDVAVHLQEVSRGKMEDPSCKHLQSKLCFPAPFCQVLVMGMDLPKDMAEKEEQSLIVKAIQAGSSSPLVGDF